MRRMFEEQPCLDITNEVRAELVALTGHDIAPDDPIMALVVLNQILLPKIADQVAGILKKANEAAENALADMRRETLKSVAADLILLAGQARESLRLDLTQAQDRASHIVSGIETSLKLQRAVWIAIGAMGFGLFALGVVVGFGIGR